MARVPGPGKRTIFTQVPDVVDTGAGSVFANLAAGLAAASNVVAPLASQEAIAQGTDAVFRDENGRLQARTRVPFTEIDQLYNEAAKSIYLTELDGEMASAVTAMSLEHQDNPAGFQQAARAYMLDVQRSAPAAFRGDVAQLAGSRINRVHSALVGGFYERQQTRAYNANVAAVDRLSAEMVGYASDPTDENLALMAEARERMFELLTIRQHLPGSTYTSEQALADLDRYDRSAAASMDSAISQMVDGAVDILKAGHSPAKIADIEAIAANTPHAGRLAVAVSAHAIKPDFALLSPAEQAEFIQGFSQNGVDEAQLEAVELFQEVHQDTLDAIARDPLAHVMSVHPELFSVPLDMTNPASVQARLTATQDAGALGFETNGRFFTDGEATEYRAMLGSKDTAQIAAVIQGAASFGPRAWSGVADQLEMTPAQTHLVALQRFGGSDLAIAKAISGMSISRPERPDDDYAASVRAEMLEPYVAAIEVLSGVQQGGVGIEAQMQSQIDRVVETAEAIFAAEMEARGMDASDDDARDVLKQSYQMAFGGSGGLGGQHEINGSSVILPPTLSGPALQSGFDAWERTYLLTPDEIEDADLFEPLPSRTRRQELAEAERDRFAAAEIQSEALRSTFWDGVSVSGGAPSISGQGGEVSERDLRGVRIIPMSNDRAVMVVTRGGGSALIRDTDTGGLFVFSLSALARKGSLQ